MVSLREIKDKGYIPQKTYLKLMIGGTLSLSKVLLTSPRQLKKLRVLHPGEPRYIRQTRKYNLPIYYDSYHFKKDNLIAFEFGFEYP